MTTKDKLELALSKVKEAEQLLNEANKENQSLNDYYGYSIELIANDLGREAKAIGRGYTTTIQEIINNWGIEWE